MFADVVEVCPGTSPTRVMTDATLTHFRELPRLRRVELSSTQVTDAGLRHLEGLAQLQSLGLAGTNITDSGLRHLRRLSQLQMLDLTQTKVTNAGMSSLTDRLTSENCISAVRKSRTQDWKGSRKCRNSKCCSWTRRGSLTRNWRPQGTDPITLSGPLSHPGHRCGIGAPQRLAPAG